MVKGAKNKQQHVTTHSVLKVPTTAGLKPRAGSQGAPRGCLHATAPDWAPLEKQILAGLHDKPSVLHLDPHHHAVHSMVASGKKQRPQTSAGTRTLPSAYSAPRPTSASSASSSSSSSSSQSSSHGISSSGEQLSPDESRAYAALRRFDRLQLENSWCGYPGPYIDMGVVEVRPTLQQQQGQQQSRGSSAAAGARENDADASSAATVPPPQQSPPRKRDPSDLSPAALRPHRYTLSLQNRASAGLKVSVASDSCEWLGLKYEAQAFLPLGVDMKIQIKAPTHMPHGVAVTGGSEADELARAASSKNGTGSTSSSGLGQGVERLGLIYLTVENSWTYQVSTLCVPIYARLVFQGSAGDRLASLPTFKPVPSVQDLHLNLPSQAQQQQGGGEQHHKYSAHKHQEEHKEQQQQQQQQPQQFQGEVRDDWASEDEDEDDYE